MAKIVLFPVQEKEVTHNPCRVSMIMTSTVNGKKVITNLANLSKEELVHALIRDAVMADKEEMIKGYIA